MKESKPGDRRKTAQMPPAEGRPPEHAASLCHAPGEFPGLGGEKGQFPHLRPESLYKHSPAKPTPQPAAAFLLLSTGSG